MQKKVYSWVDGWVDVKAAWKAKFAEEMNVGRFTREKKYVPGWMGGWVDIKAVLWIAYSNQKIQI